MLVFHFRSFSSTQTHIKMLPILFDEPLMTHLAEDKQTPTCICDDATGTATQSKAQ